jgi:hypothetical protein
MNENLRNKNGSLMFEQIEAANLPETDRRSLRELAGTAELLVDGLCWIVGRMRELVGILTLKPSPKH